MMKQCTVEMGDTKLRAKLSEGDMISRDACYHHKCMTGFTNSYKSFVKFRQDKQKRCKEIPILEVLNYLEETLEASVVILPCLKLSDVIYHILSFLTLRSIRKDSFLTRGHLWMRLLHYLKNCLLLNIFYWF